MPISETLRAAALGGAALLGLTACDPSMTGGGSASRTAVRVGGESITVAGPPGFCIDSEASNTTSDGAFLLLSDCRLIAGTTPAKGKAPVGAALTASISPGGMGGEGDDPVQTLEDLSEFVNTPEGRALLGRSGESRGVRILKTVTRRDVLYVLIEDRGPQPVAGVDRRFWRAFTDLGDQMAVLSVLSFEGSGVDAQEGFRLLAAFADRLKASNPV